VSSSGGIFFDDFELRTDRGELFRKGVQVKLQPQPARLLELLAGHAGQVVTREELRRHLWGEDTFVDFEHGLNFSVRQLRRALGDSADAPHFVETVPKHGYRFLPAVRFAPDPSVPPAPAEPQRTPARRHGRRVGFLAAKAAVFLLLLALKPQREAPPSVPPAAREAYVEGCFLTREGSSPAEQERGLAGLKRAVRLAPRFAAAYTAIARAEESRPDKSPAEKFPIVEAAARRAVALDPGQAQAHLALAWIHFYRDLDARQAGLEVERALRANPRLAEAYVERADYLAILGRHDEAIQASERARTLDPEGQLTGRDLLCYHFLLARRWNDAARCGQRVAALLPAGDYDATYARLWVLTAASRMGDTETALAMAQAQVAAFASTFPPPKRLQSLQDFWEWDLAKHEAAARQGPQSLNLALDLIAVGRDRDRAIDLLQHAVAQRDSWVVPFLGVDPRFDPLREDPRFQRLLGHHPSHRRVSFIQSGISPRGGEIPGTGQAALSPSATLTLSCNKASVT
jgi:DNA-binding winged helix-turn-helix (wHTH) protein/tetratricopeptide (TPR) repeat protein